MLKELKIRAIRMAHAAESRLRRDKGRITWLTGSPPQSIQMLFLRDVITAQNTCLVPSVPQNALPLLLHSLDETTLKCLLGDHIPRQFVMQNFPTLCVCC